MLRVLLALSLAAAASAPDPAARHLLDRLGAGAAPGELARVSRLGTENYLQAQLRGGPVAGGGEALTATPADLYERYHEGKAKTPEAKRARRLAQARILLESQQMRLQRAITSPHQLQESMVAFWFDHFNVFADKGPLRLWMGAYEQQALRPHALGRFRDLLGAVAHHPAMLFYLDNWQSAGGALNENYARELLELHTLGVDGGYSQADVTELARVLTGWGFKPRPAVTADGFQFFFNPRRHDKGSKRVLGQAFDPAGQAEGERALDLLAAHPATARHIARKLAVYFVADEPPPALVDGVAARFRGSNGDIRATLDALFHRPEFWDAHHQGSKLKTPYQYVVSAARALGPAAPPPAQLIRVLRQLGQPLYGCPTPDGYKHTQGAWLSPEAMTRRVGFAIAIANGRLAQDDFPNRGLDPNELAATLGNPFGPDSRAAIAAAPARLRPALMLGSPEFNRR